MLVSPATTIAIIQNPNQLEIDRAIERGQKFAQQHRPPNELYWHFGSGQQTEARGFLVTKISGLTVMSNHFALRGEKPTDQEIQRVLQEEAVQVVVTIFGESPGFARDSYLLLQQNDHIVKPESVRFDARAQSAGRRGGIPVFRAKIVGFFPYSTFDPLAPSTLKVFPGGGGEVKFDLDLSSIP